jgi:NADH-quinone oxidoreductase subunit L
MTVPLVILAVMSVLAGYLGLPEFLAANRFEMWLEPVTETAVTFAHPPVAVEWILMLLSITASLGGLSYAYWVYHSQNGAPAKRFSESFAVLDRLAQNAFGFDRAYRQIFTRPGEQWARVSSQTDQDVVDDGIRGSFSSVGVMSKAFSVFQSGFVRAYASAMLAGVTLLILMVLFAGGSR